jgi:hypothetical protein
VWLIVEPGTAGSHVARSVHNFQEQDEATGDCQKKISPAHKRTEGRARVRGSEFTSKDAALQGGSSRNRCWAERKIVDFGT